MNLESLPRLCCDCDDQTVRVDYKLDRGVFSCGMCGTVEIVAEYCMKIQEHATYTNAIECVRNLAWILNI